MPQPLPFKELLGFNLKIARLRADFSQAEVAAAMSELGFKDWRRQTVGNSEKGTRRVTAEELVGLALVLNVKPERLIWPESGEDMVSLPDFTFRALRLVMDDGSVTWKDGKPVAGPSNAQALTPDAARQLRGALGVGEGEHFSATFRPGDQ